MLFAGTLMNFERNPFILIIDYGTSAFLKRILVGATALTEVA
jgi:hypothetical protein